MDDRSNDWQMVGMTFLFCGVIVTGIAAVILSGLVYGDWLFDLISSVIPGIE